MPLVAPALVSPLSFARSVAALALPLAFAALFSACGGARGGQTCTDNTGCKNGYVCDDGRCIPPSGGGHSLGTCTTTLDCDAGEFCDGGFCAEGGSASCGADADCPASQYCLNRVCTARPGSTDTACTRHDDCGVGDFCNFATQHCVDCLNDDHCDLGTTCQSNGTCGTGNTACTSNFDCNGLVCEPGSGRCVQCNTSADCPLGQSCRSNQCSTTDGGAPRCERQTDCDPYGTICNITDGRCGACSADSQCGTGRVCSGGVCTQPSSSGGGGGGGGGTGQCETKADCGGMACFLGVCMPCFSDFMCFEMGDLLTGVSQICDIDTGGCVNPECTTAAQCPAGQGCWGGGHCGACEQADECRAGETCNVDTGVCGASTGSGTSCTSNAQCTGGLACVTGSCKPCTTATQCGTGMTCSASGTCTTTSGGGGGTGGGTITPGTVAYAGTCTANADCSAGLSCVQGTSGKFCTHPCIGSGKGGDADCPSGSGCLHFDVGNLDGLRICVPAAQASSTYPGQGFTQAPGASCSSGNHCQTSICFSDTQTCANECAANHDCATGEVCWGAWASDNSAMLGSHLCMDSGVPDFKTAGSACASGAECDSGMCQGECSDDGSACNNSDECVAGTCSGTCRDHCRGNSDCAGTQACAPWPTDAWNMNGWVTICQPKYFAGTKAAGASCADDNECATDWCVGGICTSVCGITADCTGALAGKTCRPVTFLDSSSNPAYSASFCQ